YISFHYDYAADGESESTLLDCLPDTRGDNPEESLVRKREMSGRLDAVRNSLSPLEAQVLDYYLEGKSYREMSAELCCPPKTVDNALQRIKRKIGESRPVE